jgi:hypothetical protein
MTNRRNLLRALPAAGLLAASAPLAAATQAPGAASQGADARKAMPRAELDQFEWRAIEAMVWGMPAVNLELMRQAMLKVTQGRTNLILYWSRLLDWKCQTLTPNSDVIYLKPFFDTREVGPVVVEVPPADDGVINGTLMDAWQSPLEDVGPAGLDGGAGGRYLLLPPGYDAPTPPGYYVFRLPTYSGYGLFRSILRSGSPADLAKAVEYGRRLKVYPLSAADNPPATTLIDADGTLFDSTIPYDARYFEHLARVVDREPWLQRDRAMIDMLRTIGIEKGKPYTPSAAQRGQLDAAAKKGLAILDEQFERLFDAPFWPGTRWAFVASQDLAAELTQGFPDPNRYATDERGLLFSFVFFAPRRLGRGQFWLMSHQDSNGAALEGGRSYRLRVPANAPINQYWSITAYDRQTHAFIREMPATSRSSQTPGLRKNRDGSVDLWLGPTAPRGWERNWLPTDPNGRVELMARFYGPEPALFDGSWRLLDVERADPPTG